ILETGCHMADVRTYKESAGKLSLVLRFAGLVLCLLLVFDGLAFLVFHFSGEIGPVGMLLAILFSLGLVFEVVSLEKSQSISKAFGLPTPSPEFIQQKQEEQANKSELHRLLGWLIGLVLIVGCGWGLIVAIGSASRAWKLGVSWELATTL